MCCFLLATGRGPLNAITSAAATGMAQPQSERKLRLLCLHGYMQNAEVRCSEGTLSNSYELLLVLQNTHADSQGVCWLSGLY